MNSNNDESYKFENQQSNKAEGFKFAVTLLVIFGYFFYNIYNYFQNEVVSLFVFVTIGILFSAITFLIIGLILYILIKGYSMELRGSVRKQNLNEIASMIYSFIFLIFIIFITYSLGFIILSYYFIEVGEIPSIFNLFLVLIIYGFSIAFTSPPSPKIFSNIIQKFGNIDLFQLIKEINDQNIKKYFKTTFSLNFLYYICEYISNKMVKYIPIFIMTTFALIFIINVSPQIIINSQIFAGSTNVDIENLHQKKDMMIPVQIQVTGIDFPISVELFKVEPNNSRPVAIINHLGTQLDNPNENYRRIFGNVSNFKNDNCLLGNALGSGKYILFINTTNLTIGYYKLEVNNGQTTSGEGFFLLDNTSILLN